MLAAPRTFPEQGIAGSSSPTRATKFASLVLVLAALISGLAFVYTLYRYGRHYPSVYLVFPIAAGLLLASLRLRPSHRVGLAMITISTGFSLLLIEVFLQYWLAGIPRRAAEAQGQDFDSRTLVEVVRDFRSRGVDAYPAFSSWLIRSPTDGQPDLIVKSGGQTLLPLGGVSNKRTVLCNETGDFAVYESDEHGFSNPKGLWREGSLQLVLVGDSFAHGACVAPAENFAGVLREQYPATLNLGIHGSGPLAELATLREYLPALRPKFVVWFYYEDNDLTDLASELKNPMLLRYLDPTHRQGLPEQQAQIDSTVAAYLNQGLASTPAANVGTQLFGIMKLNAIRTILGLTLQVKTDSFDYKPMRRVLAEAKRTTESWGGKLYFVYLPGPGRYFSPRQRQQLDAMRERVLPMVREQGIPVVDVVQVFAANGNPQQMFVYPGSHYNNRGYRVAATAVRDALSEDRR